MVGQIEGFGTKLELRLLHDRKVLEKRQVDTRNAGGLHNVAAGIAEGTGSFRLERRGINPIVQVLVSRYDRDSGDDVRPVFSVRVGNPDVGLYRTRRTGLE